MTTDKVKPPHPAIWAILYIPFGALSGFVQVGLTFMATKHGLSITEGALLNGATLLSQWLKWIWAPVVDITLTPKIWYVLSTALTALGTIAMAAIPMGPETLNLLLAVIAITSLINSIVGMSIESMMAAVTPRDDIGRVSGWFQAGNLGGVGLGGGLGLLLLDKLPQPWMSGAGLAILFMFCCLPLVLLPPVTAHEAKDGVLASVQDVGVDLWKMLKTRAGALSAFLCFLPIGTGAAQVVLAQATVAAKWGAGATDVERVQGFAAGMITAVGCFAGGYLCQLMHPRTQYATVSLFLAAVAVGMGLAPATVAMYVVWNFIYAFAVGLAYAGFTAVVLDAMGPGSAATKYNVYASLSNFPIWWVGLLLGWVADKHGAPAMLYTEAALGVVGVIAFFVAIRIFKPTDGTPGSSGSTSSP